MEREEFLLRLAAIIALGVILWTAVIMIGIVAVMTARDLWRAEALTFAGAFVLAAFAGVTLRQFRHHRRWRIEREDTNGSS